ncbi:MAG: MBOAT family protein [Flavobacteriales bacterium]|nr:MBOAT family protein [Flavobacteriales bacterium]MBP9080100.1 MBOAT family protein [Flavobacteriales bacterium]
MLFDSSGFLLFLPVVFFLYWFGTRRSLRAQNLLLLGASYYFYACWDWRFLFLLVFSTLLDYVSGLKIHQATTQHWKKAWLVLSVCINLGFLGFFKYYNFFAENFAALLSDIGWGVNPVLLNVVLPVGISFYTFHGLSYVFDVYHGKVNPVRNPVDYALFVSFFPLLVAGPIERATHLLPQIQRPRTFSRVQAVDGLRQILWGVLKKVVIADNCGAVVDQVFGDPSAQSASTLLLGTVFFAMQIYGDFSGYSDIALGTARLFGVELLQNFSFPYFSRDIAEFWRRWHISLSSWFRDYLYIPLGGSRGNNWKRVRNIFIIFLVSGFWHGAEWTFLAWGGLNAVYFLPLLLAKRNRTHMDVVAKGRMLPSLREVFQMGSTFLLTCIAWVFFRAKDMEAAWDYLKGMARPSLASLPDTKGHDTLVLLLVLFMLVEWQGREGRYALERLGLSWPRPMRLAFYGTLACCILLLMRPGQMPFIYFQF